MIKERLKSCLLFVLIMSSIVLTTNILFNGKLWPDGYNFFSNITKLFESDISNKSYYLSKENISNPKLIIVNNYETRNLYTHTSKQYNNISEDVLNVIKDSIKNYDFSEAKSEDWNNALKVGSIYVSYPVAYDMDLLCNILNITSKSSVIKSVKEFIIVPSTLSNSNTISVYIKDYATKTVYNTIFDTDIYPVKSIISNYSVNSLNELPYSFELFFDKTDDQTIKQKVIIEPTITLDLNENKLPVLKSENYLENIYNSEISKDLLKGFGYNSTNTKASHLDNNNTAVYVENFSTLKVYKNGLVEYKSIDSTKGIELTGDANADLYDNFMACIEFVNNLWDTTLPDEELNINLTSDVLSKSDSGSFKITMDYYVNGHLVVLEDNRHAVEITVTNGKITEYRQLFNKFMIDEEFDYVSIGSSITALDKLYADKNLENGTISELNIVYSNKDGRWYPYWGVILNGSNKIIRGE